MAEGSARTKLATVALVIVGFALGFAEFIVIGITPDIAEEYGISLASAGNRWASLLFHMRCRRRSLCFLPGVFAGFPCS